MAGYGLISGFLIRLLNNRLDRGANRAITNDLAEGAIRPEPLGGMQERATVIIQLAELGNIGVVVKNFGREEVEFTGKQHAHNQRAHPKLMPVFSPVSHVDVFALPLL